MFLAAGMAVWLLKVPERWSPGRFDFALHSHQWMHAAVFCASALFLQIFVHLFRYHVDTYIDVQY